MFDGKMLGEQLTVIVRDFVARAMAGIAQRVEAVEQAVKAIPAGAKGDRGELGERGADGPPGKGAYQLAVERGFAGTELQWLDSLQGLPGAKGTDGKDADPQTIRAEVERAAAALPRPQDGRSVTLDDVAPLIAGAVAERVAAIPAPANGKDASPEQIAAAVEAGIASALPAAVQRAIDALMPELIAKAAEAVPRPRDGVDGKSVNEAEVIASLTEKMLRAVDALPKAKDGRDGREATSVLDIDAAVARAVALIPEPRDGKSAYEIALDHGYTGTEAQWLDTQKGADGRAGPRGKDADIDAVVEKVVPLIPRPRDGVDGKDAPVIDLETVTEAVLKRLPEVKSGADGRDGVDGTSVTVDDLRPIVEAEAVRWQLEFERRAADVLQHAIDALPAPENGRDGKDALAVDDFEVSLDGRVFTFALRCGDRVVKREIKVPFPVDRGVYRSGMKAEQGDVVTFGGSQWIANRDTDQKPPHADWRLQVRRGQDGKAAVGT